MNVEAIKEKWEKSYDSYNSLGQIVVKQLKETLTDKEILPEITFRVKDLISTIKKVKRKSLNSSYSFEDLNDKLGVRIICDFQEHLQDVDKVVREYFNIDKVEYKKELLEFNNLGYVSNHYDLYLNNIKWDLKNTETISHLKFELQVRTINQHTWSHISHKLLYKRDVSVTDHHKRRLFRLLSLYEIADDEMSYIQSHINRNPVRSVEALIDKLEGKVYKYAKADYDKKLSVNNLSIIFSYLDDHIIDDVFENIDLFITENESKIKRIYNDNIDRIYNYPLLTQPEAFVIWYGLMKFKFRIIDNWAVNFEYDELESIANLWGISTH